MAQTILLKRRTADATAPGASDLTTGEIAVNAYSGKLYVKKTDGSVAEISGSGGDAGLIPSATFKRFEYTATNGQTTFSGNDNGSQSLSYVAGNILVYLNGVLLDDTVDYVASNGTSVVLQDGATTSDLLTIISYNKNIGTGNTTIDTFSGNGSTTAFTLSEDPENENNTSVFIDGIYSPFLSDTTHDGLDVCLLSAALTKPKYKNLINKYFDKISDKKDSLTLLNTSFSIEGAYIYLPKSFTAEKPVEIMHFSTGKQGDFFLQPRNLIIIEENAEVQILERHQSLSNHISFTNSVTEIYA